MKVKLKGMLDNDLTRLGLRPGDEIEVTVDRTSKVGIVNFTQTVATIPVHCSLWPENYEIIKA